LTTLTDIFLSAFSVPTREELQWFGVSRERVLPQEVLATEDRPEQSVALWFLFQNFKTSTQVCTLVVALQRVEEFT
jgi:hypothetical protein